MSNPPQYNPSSIPSYGGYNAVVRPPIPYNPPPASSQYTQPENVPVTQQVYYTPYSQQLAPGQAPYASMYGNNQQLYGLQGGNGQTPGQYPQYQYRQWGYGNYGPYYTLVHAVASNGQAQSSLPAVHQGYGSQQYGYQGLHPTGQAQAGQIPMPPTTGNTHHQTTPHYPSQSVQQQVQAQYSYAQSLTTSRALQSEPYRQYGTESQQHHQVQQKVQTPPMPSSTWSTTGVSGQQTNHAQPAPVGLPQLPPVKCPETTTNTTSVTEKKFTDYRSLPSDASSTPPRPSSPVEAAKIPTNQQHNTLPKRPRSPRSSTSSTVNGNSISDFVSSKAPYVTSAFEPSQSSQLVKSEPSSTILKGAPASSPSAGNAQVQKTIANTEQSALAVTVQQKPSLEVVKQKVAAAKKRLEDISNRTKNSSSSKSEDSKVKPESERQGPVLNASNIKKIPLTKPARAPDTQEIKAQRAKENVNPAMPKATTSTPRTALCHQPDIKAELEHHNGRPAAKNEPIRSAIHDKVIRNENGERDANSKTGNALASSKPSGELASTESAIAEKLESIKRPAQPTVVFLRPGKVVIEARKSNRSVQPAELVEKSTPMNRVAGQTGSQQYSLQDALGLKYLSSVSPEEHIDQKLRSSQLSAPKGSLATYRRGGLIKPEPAPTVTAHLSTAISTGAVPSQSRPILSSRSAQNGKPNLKVEFSPVAPHNTRQHFTPVPRNATEIDPDLEDFLAGTSKIEYQSDDPDMPDFLVATSIPLTTSDHFNDPDLQDFFIATSQTQAKSVGAEDSQPSDKSFSLGRYFVSFSSIFLLVLMLTQLQKKSFVEASLVKPTNNKIQIASVKMCPGFEAANNAKDVQEGKSRTIDPPSSFEEGQILESDESFLPYDYTSTDRPKVPRPSLARTVSQPVQNGILSYDEPVPKRRKRKSSDISLWSPPTFSSPEVKTTQPICYSPTKFVFDSIPSPPLPKKGFHPKLESTSIILSGIPSDLDMEDTIMVDCSAWRKEIPAEESEDEMPAPRPRKKRLVRRSEVKSTLVKLAVDDDSDKSIVVRKPARRRPSSGKRQSTSTEKVMRYATEDEMKLLASSIEDAQSEARTEANYDKPDSHEECVPESNWQPYKCFGCCQTWSQNHEITKHLETRHSIILPRKFKAWQCFFPECPKGFCDRTGALKHAKTHFNKV
ncbi:hypothetical protein DL98DRAFT_577795 [Cadophora sp. DSE1049]|nr:hypothetical protein DL98DRAFT_577795 [Cadophora sp. DSE1049]